MITGADISKLLEVETVKQSRIVRMFGHQAALLMLLYRLDVIGVRKITYSYAQMLTNNQIVPPCSIPMAVVSINREFIQFCPKRMADKDFKI